MRTIISFSDKTLRAVQGGFDGIKFNIAAHCTVNIPSGAADGMASALLEARDKLKKFKTCEIVLNNPLFITAELQWMGAKGFERVAKNAFLYRKDFDEASFVTDYMVLKKEREDNRLLLLFGALKCDVLKGYSDLFKEARLSISRVDMAMAGLLKLAVKSSAFNPKTVLISLMEGETLTLCSFRENGALFTARIHMNEKEDTEDYYNRVAREVYSHSKYKKTNRLGGEAVERGHLYIFDLNPKANMSEYAKALKTNATTEDYYSVGVRSALSGNQFLGEDDIEPYALLIGTLLK